MPKKMDFGNVVGKCSVCTINLWDASGGEPVVWPCGVKDCPYESADQKDSHLKLQHHSEMGSGLAQIEF